MTPIRHRARQTVLACSLSAVGLGYTAVLLSGRANSRVAAWVDRNLLPSGVTW